MPATYDYRIDEDTTGGKPKWWVIRFPVKFPLESDLPNNQQVQRLSRHDAPQQAADEVLRLKRANMGG